MAFEFGKFGRHRWVATSQSLDRHLLRLVVRKTKVPIGAEEGLLRLLQMVDRLVDLINRFLKVPGGKVVIPRAPA